MEQTLMNEHLIKNFPYIKQTDSNCGGASAAMLFSFYGFKDVTQEYVKSKCYPDQNGGIDDHKLSEFMQKEANTKNLRCIPNGSTNIDNIRCCILCENPVLILFNDKLDSWHYAVIIGFNHNDKIFIFADPFYGNIFKRSYDSVFPTNVNLFTIILSYATNL